MLLDELEKDVSNQASNKLEEVMRKVFLKLEIRESRCSYKAYINSYSFFRKVIKRGRYADPTPVKLNYLREKLYSNPCKKCDSCRTRRKAWPV